MSKVDWVGGRTSVSGRVRGPVPTCPVPSLTNRRGTLSWNDQNEDIPIYFVSPPVLLKLDLSDLGQGG